MKHADSRQTPKVNRLLIQLMEECAEVQQVASKALRFGLTDNYKHSTPEDRLALELDDLRVVVMKLLHHKIQLHPCPKRQARKWRKLEKMDAYGDQAMKL